MSRSESLRRVYSGAEALRVDIPLDVLAEALPYDGATEVEAEALIDALVDAGWLIVPSPRYGR